MNENKIICAADLLIEKGQGHRFYVKFGARVIPAFVIRHDGAPRAYLNQCAHMSVELDWQKGDFFNTGKDHLMCATHGALYNPNTGACVYGRCDRQGLTVLDISEINGQILLNDENGIHLTSEPEMKLSND